MLLSLQGSHKPHCLKKKENIWGCKTYSTTFPSHPTPIPPKSNEKFIFKVPSSILLLFYFFLEHRIIETTYTPRHTHTHTHTHTFAPPKVKCKIHIQVAPSFYIVGDTNLNTKLVFKSVSICNLIIWLSCNLNKFF